MLEALPSRCDPKKLEIWFRVQGSGFRVRVQGLGFCPSPEAPATAVVVLPGDLYAARPAWDSQDAGRRIQGSAIPWSFKSTNNPYIGP